MFCVNTAPEKYSTGGVCTKSSDYRENARFGISLCLKKSCWGMVANSTTSENMAWYRVDAQRQPHKDGRAKVHDNQDSLSQGH